MAEATAFEQLSLELMNQARFDPQGEFDRIIIDDGAVSGTIVTIDPEITSALNFFGVDLAVYKDQLSQLSGVAPLAWNSNLNDAASDHNDAMIAADTQSHQLSGELGLGARLTAAGYDNWSNAGENIYAYTESAIYGHAGFFIDWGFTDTGIQQPAGHRNSMMSTTFTEVGIDVTAETNPNTDVGPFVQTQDFGTRWDYEAQFVGVAYTDDDGDNFYSMGEADAGISVSIGGGSSTTTATAGGYGVIGVAGDTQITFSGGGLSASVSATITFGTENVKVDLMDGVTIKSTASTVLNANAENLVLLGDFAFDTDGTGNGLNNNLTGSGGDNLLYGLGGNDTLTGGAGNDTLDGGTGADTMTGGGDDDSYFVDNAGDVIIELAAGGSADVVRSTATYTLANNIEQLRLQGSANIDATGNTGDNLLVGNAGNNRLNGVAGADTLQGGDGDDIYFIDNAGDVVVEGSNLGTDQIQSSISITLASNIENGLLLTSANLDLTGNAFGNTLFGNAGNNILDGAAGVDVMAGGAGDDTYIVDLPSDFVSEQAAAGTDLVQSTVNYSLRPNIENLTLLGTANLQGIGNAENNILIGNSGANHLNGSFGADTMMGGDGNDIFSVDDAGDVVTENANEGVDTILSFATQTLGANVERLYLFGSADINATGNAENNGLLGNNGSNAINGEAGNDLLFGGLGNDTMTGGAGNDTFFFHTALDGVNNVETLTDFTHADDTMRLDSSIFTGLSTGLLSSSVYLIGTAAGDADDRIIYDNTTGDLFFDADGTGAGAQVQFATLDDMPADVAFNDFLVF